MPVARISMRQIKEVLRLKHAARLSHRQIARALKLSLGVVSKYLSAAEWVGLSWPLPDGMDDVALERALWPGAEPPEPRFARPDFSYVHEQLRRKGVTRQLLWEEYRASHPEDGYGYTQFCVFYREWTRRLRLSMRQTHRAGEKLFVDYAGQTVSVVNAVTGEAREAQVFVAVLGASNYTYAEATWTQCLPDWVSSHTRAFAFFGGTPRLVVPDNLKSGVSRACRYEPLLNTTYAEMLAHYQTAALPARPYKPKDKAKVEAGVQLVERWILARLRHQTFFSLFDLNLAIRHLVTALNERPFKRLPGSRLTQFGQLDRPCLRPLPARAYEYAEWKKVRVHLDYHAEVEGHYYSVPHALVRRELEARLTATCVEFFHHGKRVASHARSARRGAHSTQAEHMPKAHRAHLEWTPGRFLTWAVEVGPSTRDLVRHLLEGRPHPEMGYRSCLGLLSLAKQYGKERLETACARALALSSPTRRSVHSILRRGLDRLPPAGEEPLITIRAHENVRGPDYYR
ncbi:MAG TPA: IS21 family transposase [Pyrinomonadaceae bacterium]